MKTWDEEMNIGGVAPVISYHITTVVVALLSIEVVAIILLLGAQVIAELECRPRERKRCE